MGQYYRYYDDNGRSVYTEVQTLAGPEQEQPLPRGAVPLDRDTFHTAMAAIERATELAEKAADSLGEIGSPEAPPGGEDPDDGEEHFAFTSRGVV